VEISTGLCASPVFHDYAKTLLIAGMIAGAVGIMRKNSLHQAHIYLFLHLIAADIDYGIVQFDLCGFPG